MDVHITFARSVLGHVYFPGYRFEVARTGSDAHTYLLARFDTHCSDTGRMETQTTRKWLLSPHMTQSEIIQTALKCVLTSIEHEARESFRYRGRAIFSPHFDVDTLVDLVDSKRFDVRGQA